MKTSVVVGASLVATPFLLVGAIVIGTMSVASGSSAMSPVGRIADGTVPAADAALMEQYGHMCPELTPSLLAAQLYQESGFDPTIVSPAGAIGIAQFMPGTWPNWSSPQDGDGKQDPRNPADAIPAAARYLRASGAPDDYHAALFAYNHAEWYVKRVLAAERKYR